MPADALNYLHVSNELCALLKGGRIDKITMPEADEIAISIRANGKSHSLIISANAAMPRLHLTSANKPSPLTAPAFLMHLRKHISSAEIEDICLVPYERIIEIKLIAKNEMGYTENKRLIAEIMGKYSNIILVNQNGKVSDSIKHVTQDTSTKRQILPGLTYNYAPAQNKITVCDTNALTNVINGFGGGRLDNYILKNLSGLAPATITFAVNSALNSTDFSQSLTQTQVTSVVNSLSTLYTCPPKPCLSANKKDFFFTPYSKDTNLIFFDSLNAAMNECYCSVDNSNRICSRTHALNAVVKNAIARTEKKIATLSQKQQDAQNLESDKLFGELITANIYRVKYGDSNLIAQNYYLDPPENVTINLDNKLSPQQNAQKYYKAYAKKKKTLEMTKTQLEEAQTDLLYFGSIAQSFLLITTPDEIKDIFDEMVTAGLIKPTEKKGKNGKNNKSKKPETKTLIAKKEFGGYTIRYGKNNLQNDRLTKQSNSNDIWLHTQKIHGSHVVIECATKDFPPSDVIKYAAGLAAAQSKAFLSDNVAVDYTHIKYVSKPKGAKPGMVIYTNQHTVYVTPLSKN